MRRFLRSLMRKVSPERPWSIMLWRAMRRTNSTIRGCSTKLECQHTRTRNRPHDLGIFEDTTSVVDGAMCMKAGTK